ncbi:hypothetical protein BUALT_Bualt13G0102300 [Buddleja alternifolia]|uniref:RING-type E3 ubiquitin transferase n=1 Tax=Buddleja alternifolia TaxID=168488 RepID=A0AAV6WKG3_9LAMI|nr:hypothetical protein BUALT_Bualt13G0102300 [Buddleja alternifolia]
MVSTYKYHRLPRLLLDSGIHVEPTNGSTTSSGIYNKEANFDSNKVIVLVALLCALICALGLKSIVRCALRCTRTLDYGIGDDEMAARLASSNNLKKEALSNYIPVVVYKPGLDILATDCAICLGEFVEGEDVRVFPGCNHGFHVRCIDRWLVLRSSCPTCRRPLIEDSMSGGAQHVSVQIN